MIFWLVLKLEISHRLMTFLRILFLLEGFFFKITFLHGDF
jgi:hypothetical protein